MLALKFIDVSNLVNWQTPIAAPVSAEACIIARRNLKEMKYFEMKKVSASEIERRFKPYNGVDDLPHRRDQKKTDDGMADYDFYLSWTPKQ
jgi:hypothetical protein